MSVDMMKGLLLVICLLSSSFGGEVTRSSDSFGNILYSTLPINQQNAVFSPLSLHSTLSLAYEASTGRTQSKMKSVLGLPTQRAVADQYKWILSDLNTKTDVKINIANKIYVKNDRTINDKYKYLAREFFFADVDSVDFTKPQQAANEINSWVSQNTGGNIAELVTPDLFDKYTRSVLLNAIYIKGKWAAKFDSEQTKTEKFYVNAKQTVNCPMMHRLGEYFYSESPDLDATLVKLPFRDSRFGLVVILPNSKTGIDDLERKLTRANITAEVDLLWGRLVDVYLPRFKISSSFDFEDPLRELGLSQIFADNAEFPNMINGGENLKISRIIQKATVEINEEGGEASAATSAIIAVPVSASYEPPDLVVFKADHPFVFLITARVEKDEYNFHNSEVVLFMGKVTVPEVVN